ncbi:MAG: hypothetical protein REI94_08605 [Moraxellaceae bacterium]|nr:hypothetical protein [Moraxellaceae bacterium]
MSIAITLGRQRARLLEAIGLRRLAAHAWGEVLLIDPSNLEAACRLGRIALARRREEEALGWFTRATRLAGDDAAAWYGLGLSHAGLGAHADAADAFAHALTQRPDDGDVLHQLGLAQHRAGQGDAFGLTLAKLDRIDASRARLLRDELAEAAGSDAT